MKTDHTIHLLPKLADGNRDEPFRVRPRAYLTLVCIARLNFPKTVPTSASTFWW
jgi:hypothetical protein